MITRRPLLHYVHRVVWQATHGTIPRGGDEHVHHLCEQTLCCEITHLALKPPSEHGRIHYHA